MRFDFREIIQGCCMIGVFLGLLIIDINIYIGAALTITCGGIFFLLEKGIM